MIIFMDGTLIKDEKDFYVVIADALHVRRNYVTNLDAVYDLFTVDVGRPIVIEWMHSQISRKSLGKRFNDIINLFDDIIKNDQVLSNSDKFSYRLL